MDVVFWLLLPLLGVADLLFVNVGYVVFVVLVWCRCKRLVMWLAHWALRQ